MTNYEWIKSMPEPVFAQWLCDINKCDHCYFKEQKEEDRPGICTWQWLNKTFPLSEELVDERPEQNQSST